MGKSGKVLIICAPSGTGKSTIINYLREQGIEFHFSISATSRAPRGKERNGVEYFFKTEEEMGRGVCRTTLRNSQERSGENSD